MFRKLQGEVPTCARRTQQGLVQSVGPSHNLYCSVPAWCRDTRASPICGPALLLRPAPHLRLLPAVVVHLAGGVHGGGTQHHAAARAQHPRQRNHHSQRAVLHCSSREPWLLHGKNLHRSIITAC